MRIREDPEFLREQSIAVDEWNLILRGAKQKLLQARSKRVPPGLDDKVIAGWNAMSICGLIDAYRAFEDRIFLDTALKNLKFIEKELISGKTLYRSFKNQRSQTEAFLDDYAFLIQALVKIYQVTFQESYVILAADILQHVIDQFFDSSDGFFFYTSAASEPLITRKKEIFDNVIPSSNAVMAQNLNQLGVLLDREDWRQISEAMTNSLSHLVKGEPGFMSYWAIVYLEVKKGFAEIVLKGKDIDAMRSELQKTFLPFSLIQGGENESQLPLQKDKSPIGGKPTIYVCYNRTCKLPVHSVAEALEQVDA
jgi:uncharacterized protein